MSLIEVLEPFCYKPDCAEAQMKFDELHPMHQKELIDHSERLINKCINPIRYIESRLSIRIISRIDRMMIDTGREPYRL